MARRLAACAQVVAPISSTYWWAGEVQQAEEWLLLMKTTADRFEDLAACVRELHSYEVPEIVRFRSCRGHRTTWSGSGGRRSQSETSSADVAE
ncbi:divalent-cation tolerance protein CutA [Microbispora siamensis]|uniref:divalent-cation tolerance protein CutA n=1 Tax=Microbispora siamensis TaxID=564413 RepID=UPI0027E5B9AD|nr:divalent-cation tolerance protein CutA [Microbispora siamensis]